MKDYTFVGLQHLLNCLTSEHASIYIIYSFYMHSHKMSIHEIYSTIFISAVQNIKILAVISNVVTNID